MRSTQSCRKYVVHSRDIDAEFHNVYNKSMAHTKGVRFVKPHVGDSLKIYCGLWLIPLTGLIVASTDDDETQI